MSIKRSNLIEKGAELRTILLSKKKITYGDCEIFYYKTDYDYDYNYNMMQEGNILNLNKYYLNCFKIIKSIVALNTLDVDYDIIKWASRQATLLLNIYNLEYNNYIICNNILIICNNIENEIKKYINFFLYSNLNTSDYILELKYIQISNYLKIEFLNNFKWLLPLIQSYYIKF
jgi:hypothetical protein